jgi:hypothetical protein
VPEQSNQASLQRRANWVGLRTLRQRPKLVGATRDGEPVFEIRSARLVLRGLSPHFNRLAACSRCGRDVPGAPVLTVADLERPLRPMICSDCVRGTGVSTVWDATTARPPAGEAPAAEAPAAEAAEAPVPAVPAAAVGPGPDDGRLETFERHLRAVTDRVNALGQALWAQRDDVEARRLAEEAARAEAARLGEQVAAVAGVGDRVDGQRAELAAVVSAIGELRSEMQRLSDGNRALVRSHQELEGRLAEIAVGPPAEPPAVAPEQLAAMVAAQEELERRVAAAEIRPAVAPDLEGLLAARLGDVERRLTDQIAGQSADLETAIETSVRVSSAGLVRTYEELAETQSGILQRLDVLAAQVAQVTSRMDAMAAWVGTTNERLDALEDRAERSLLATGPALEVPGWRHAVEPADAPAGSLLDALEHQLQGAANRLAARSERAPVD